MKNFDIFYVDCVWSNCKNFQKINSIEMFFSIDINDNFCIEYNFHKIDFNFWLEIIEIHSEDIETILYDWNSVIIERNKIINSQEYYMFILKSKDFNLYRNINYIFYLENRDTKWNNMEEMLRLNTWK